MVIYNSVEITFLRKLKYDSICKPYEVMVSIFACPYRGSIKIY